MVARRSYYARRINARLSICLGSSSRGIGYPSSLPRLECIVLASRNKQAFLRLGCVLGSTSLQAAVGSKPLALAYTYTTGCIRVSKNIALLGSPVNRGQWLLYWAQASFQDNVAMKAKAVQAFFERVANRLGQGILHRGVVRLPQQHVGAGDATA